MEGTRKQYQEWKRDYNYKCLKNNKVIKGIIEKIIKLTDWKHGDEVDKFLLSCKKYSSKYTQFYTDYSRFLKRNTNSFYKNSIMLTSSQISLMNIY